MPAAGSSGSCDQRQQRVHGAVAGDQADRLAGGVELDFLEAVGDHVADLVLDNLDQIVQVSSFAGVVIGDESSTNGQRRGDGGFVQAGLDFTLPAPGLGVAGSARRGDFADDLVATDALLAPGRDSRGQCFQAVEAGRDVVEEVGSEDLAAHDLVEAAGDLLIHRDPGGGLQQAVGFLVRELAGVVALELESLSEGDRPGTDDGGAYWHEGLLAHPASA